MYIGVTRNIERRLYEHKNKLIDGFSKKYNLNVLLFYETTEYALDAIAREKQLKKWKRKKKFFYYSHQKNYLYVENNI